MKKLLLSLFAVALMVVACNKEENVSIEPSSAELENVQIESADMSEVINILNGIGFTGSDVQNAVAPKGDGSASRDNAESTAANCIDNRPDIPAGKTAIDFQYNPIDATSGYFITRGGGDVPLLLNRPIVRFLVGTSSEDVQLQLFVFANGVYGNALPLGTTGHSPVFAILAADGYITIDRTDLYLDSLTNGDGVSAAAASIECAGVDYSQFYEVIPAPFPLSGFLARITGDLTGMGDGSSLNYAASTEAAVREAIENDIQN